MTFETLVPVLPVENTEYVSNLSEETEVGVNMLAKLVHTLNYNSSKMKK